MTPLPKQRISRRLFLKRSVQAAGVVSLSVCGYAWRIEPHWIDVVHRTLPVANLPRYLVGKTLVQISDLHIGPVVDEAYIGAAMRRVSALQADILVITGDFMTTNGTEQVPAVARVLSNLQPGRLATIAIMGNHDYGYLWQNVAAADALTNMLRGRGITVLRNEVTDVTGLQVGGLDEFLSPNFNLDPVIAGIDPKRASLILCHNPDAMDQGGWAGYRGWILSGHTHGGQCKPPFLPPPIIPVNNKRYTSGVIDLYDGRMMYINRGLGYLHRVRFNARPEITVFTLA